MPSRADRPYARDNASERKAFDAQRRVDPIRKLYGSVTWKATSRAVILRDILCQACHKAFATVADHIVPARRWLQLHDGDLMRFFDESNLQGLCKPCHDAKTAVECGWAGNGKG